MSENFLIKDFEQAYENMRATDNKRDVIIGFYATLVAVIGGLVLKNCENLCNIQGLDRIGLFSLWIIGFVIFGILIQYRWWHAYWATLANKIRGEIAEKDIKDFYERILLYPVKSFSLWGVEFNIVFLHAVINSIVGALFIWSGNLGNQTKIVIPFGVVILWLLHLFALLFWYYFQLHFEKKIYDMKKFKGKKEHVAKQLYIYFIPISIFLCVIISFLIPSLLLKILSFIILLLIAWWFLWKNKDLLISDAPYYLKKIEKEIVRIHKRFKK
ncbi:hypothetical protein KAS42_05930 [bacterium]|nr:hypothetical protein [bacterium]